MARFFVREAAKGDIDVFRIFDALNWMENIRPAIDAVASENKVAEAAVCYTCGILYPDRTKYSLMYYGDLAREMERPCAHVLGIKGHLFVRA